MSARRSQTPPLTAPLAGHTAARQGRIDPRHDAAKAAVSIRPADGAAHVDLFAAVQAIGVRLFVALFGRCFHTGGVARLPAPDDWNQREAFQCVPIRREWR